VPKNANLLRAGALPVAHLVLLLAPAGPAAAQSPSQSPSLNEIVVTAKQRTEKLQDVPLSITVLNEQELERARITELRALAEYTPNLVFTAGQGRESPSTLAVRGVAPNTGDIRLQGVSVFLDGVYVGGAVQSLDLTQLERVEVVRGPQSTTFGRQTYAGALNYITKTPKTDVITGSVKTNYSANEGAASDNWQIIGGVQLPVVKDRMWLELGATKKVLGAMAESGSIVNRNTANQFFREVNVGEEVTESYTFGLLIEPIENLSIRVRGIHSQDRDGPPLTVALHPQEWAAEGLKTVVRGAGSTSPTDLGFLWPNDTIRDVPDPSAGSCDSIAERPFGCGVDRDRNFFSSNITYRLNDYELTYLAGWAEDTRWSNSDLYFRGAFPDPFFGEAPLRTPGATKSAMFFTGQKQTYTNQSHELRILSPVGERLSWRAGLYYFSEKERFYVASQRSPTNPKGTFRAPQEVQNYAVFGGLTWLFTDQWSVELEGRWQREKNFLGACPTGRCDIPNNNARNFTTTETDDHFLPRVTLMYRPVQDVMFYALFSQGTKVGRFNSNAATNFLYVEPEELTNYELGAKTSWLDGRLAVNAALFTMDVKDQQFSVVTLDPVTQNPITAFANVGKSDIWGFELDGRFRFSERWNASAGVGYADHEYRSAFAPPGGAANAPLVRLFDGETFKGKTSVSLPQWTGFFATQYVQPIKSDVEFIFDGNVTYTGESYADQANVAQIPGVTRVNLRGTLAVGRRWEAALFVRDLFDNDQPIAGLNNTTNVCAYLPNPNPFPNQRCLGVVLDRGREAGAQVNVYF
jgi:outer membrane receptor protein involved in Fe transport